VVVFCKGGGRNSFLRSTGKKLYLSGRKRKKLPVFRLLTGGGEKRKKFGWGKKEKRGGPRTGEGLPKKGECLSRLQRGGGFCPRPKGGVE